MTERTRDKLRLVLGAIGFGVIILLAFIMLTGCLSIPKGGGGGSLPGDYGSDPQSWALLPVVGVGALSMIGGIVMIALRSVRMGVIMLLTGIGMSVGTYLLLVVLKPFMWVLIAAAVVALGILGWHFWLVLARARVVKRAKALRNGGGGHSPQHGPQPA
jgi:hypothetical protein